MMMLGMVHGMVMVWLARPPHRLKFLAVQCWPVVGDDAALAKAVNVSQKGKDEQQQQQHKTGA